METIKEYVARRKVELREEASRFSSKPTLVIYQVGHDAGSDAYIKGKIKDATEVGFDAIHRWFPEDAKKDDIASKILEDAKDPNVDGIIVQLPLPKHIVETDLTELVPVEKDVDGFRYGSHFDPCTPKGAVDYLTAQGFEFEGSNAVVIGRSKIVGKPMARLLLGKNMNVTTLHSRTKEVDMAFYIAHADLVVAAVGREGFVDGRFTFKDTAYIIDVGINRGADGKLHGDVVPGIPVAYQSPVPGGVGLLTRIALMENVFKARKEKE